LNAKRESEAVKGQYPVYTRAFVNSFVWLSLFRCPHRFYK